MPAQKLVDKHSLKILNMEPANIPSNNSRQHLMPGQQCVDDCDSLDGIVPSRSSADARRTGRRGGILTRHWLTVGILCFVNLINYMDRFTIAGVLTDVQKDFKIQDDMGGLLQTAFILSYMVFAPLFGYLGDRYSRKAIMAFGVFLWSLTTLLGSFMTNYSWFLVFRTLVGIGEASYSTIAPTIISDLFVHDVRSKMLALFYFAIPVGSGLGYIVGSEVAHLAGSWHWGLRVTPVAGAIAVLLILFVLEDPERGEIEGSHLSPTSWTQDIKALSKNQTFMLTTAGFTCVAFVTGALAWWGPAFIHSGLVLQPGHEDVTLNDVSYKFGIITMFSGLIGVPLGSFLAQWLRPRYPYIDAVICAMGLFCSTPLLFMAMLVASSNTVLCFTLVFAGELVLNLNWSIVADMTLYVVIPTRRSTAEAFQILISHALGDAGSPYLVGVISESLKGVLSESPSYLSNGKVSNLTTALANTTAPLFEPAVDPLVKFHSLQYALFTSSFVEILGGCFFLFAALYIVRDKLRAESAVSDNGHPTHLFADDANDHRDTLMAHSTTVVA